MKEDIPNAFAFPLRTEYQTSWGMTLRDYFAAKAMQALIRDIGTQKPNLDKTDPSDCAEASYLIADAMLEARLK